MPEPSRALVTGGAGFIGSHVTEALVARGYEVAVIDSMATGTKANLNEKTLLFEIDVRDTKKLGAAFAEFRPSVVCHHAAQVSVSVSTRQPLADADVNVAGSLAVLEASRRHEVEHFIFASTGGAIYGEPSVLPCTETALIRPLSPYGAAKAAIEGYLWAYRQTCGLSCTSLRYANVYGPRQSPWGEAGVVAIFASAMINRNSPTIFGDGTDTRDYVYVSDVAAANVLATEHKLDGVYNIGTGLETSTSALAKEVALATDYKGSITYGPARVGDVSRIALDSSAFTKATGWSPTVELAEGVRQAVEHIRKNG